MTQSEHKPHKPREDQDQQSACTICPNTCHKHIPNQLRCPIVEISVFFFLRLATCFVSHGWGATLVTLGHGTNVMGRGATGPFVRVPVGRLRVVAPRMDRLR